MVLQPPCQRGFVAHGVAGKRPRACQCASERASVWLLRGEPARGKCGEGPSCRGYRGHYVIACRMRGRIAKTDGGSRTTAVHGKPAFGNGIGKASWLCSRADRPSGFRLPWCDAVARQDGDAADRNRRLRSRYRCLRWWQHGEQVYETVPTGMPPCKQLCSDSRWQTDRCAHDSYGHSRGDTIAGIGCNGCCPERQA